MRPVSEAHLGWNEDANGTPCERFRYESSSFVDQR